MKDLDDFIKSDFIVLDTETTGLGNRAEIVEIAVVDKNGNALFDSLIKPKNPIPADAIRIHGISNEAVADAPGWPDVYDQVQNLIDGRRVAIYNADYDNRIIWQTCQIYNLSSPKYSYRCVMLEYAEFWGAWDNDRGHYKWQKLTNAAMQQGIPVKGAHRAKGDCLMTLELLRKMRHF